MYNRYIFFLAIYIATTHGTGAVCFGCDVKYYEFDDTINMTLTNKTVTDIMCTDGKFACDYNVKLWFETLDNNVTIKCFSDKSYHLGYHYLTYIEPLLVGNEYKVILNDDQTMCQLVNTYNGIPFKDENCCVYYDECCA